MASAKIFRINYKSDFILTLESDAGWMTPFCIKFWTGAPSQAYYVSWDGETYDHCSFDPSEPTKLQVQFDDHHLPIGNLKYQVAYHFTVADFPNDTEDEVLNSSNITTEIDGETYQVMLDFNGETAPEIEFSLQAYANEAQRIANEQQRITNEEQRIAAETVRIQNEQQRIAHEQIRQQNEQQRINQEQARVNEYAGLKADAVAATGAANDAAALANKKAQLAADKAALADSAATLANQKAKLAADKAALANDAAQLANEKATLAQQKAEYALAQGDYAKDQGDYAKAQGDTALDDHQRAEADHGIAVDDHTQAGNDHTRAESDHGIAVDDHTQAGNDHTRAESDHGIAVDDHTQAGNDHTRAESDHGIAVDDHTQAGNDHTRAESDHTRAESDHAAVEVYVDSLGVFDLSKHNAVGGVLATYADLSAALTALNALDSKYKYGGMSFKFVHTSDNKYVQFRCMAQNFTTDVTKWQGVDDKPTAGSDNLVKSGGVSDSVESIKAILGAAIKKEVTDNDWQSGYLVTSGGGKQAASEFSIAYIPVESGDVVYMWGHGSSEMAAISYTSNTSGIYYNVLKVGTGSTRNKQSWSAEIPERSAPSLYAVLCKYNDYPCHAFILDSSVLKRLITAENNISNILQNIGIIENSVNNLGGIIDNQCLKESDFESKSVVYSNSSNASVIEKVGIANTIIKSIELIDVQDYQPGQISIMQMYYYQKTSSVNRWVNRIRLTQNGTQVWQYDIAIDMWSRPAEDAVIVSTKSHVKVTWNARALFDAGTGSSGYLLSYEDDTSITPSPYLLRDIAETAQKNYVLNSWLAEHSVSEDKLTQELIDKINESSTPSILKGKHLVTICDSLGLEGVWQTKLAELTGMVFDATANSTKYSKGGTKTLTSGYSCGQGRALQLIDDVDNNLIDTPDIIIIENVNDGGADPGTLTDESFVLSEIITLPDSYKQISQSAAVEYWNTNMATILGGITPKSGTIVKLPYSTDIGIKLTITHAATSSGQFSIYLTDSELKNIDIAAGDSIETIVDKIMTYNFLNYNLEKVGTDSVVFTKGYPPMGTIVVSDTGTGITYTTTSGIEGTMYISRYYKGHNIANWLVADNWVSSIPLYQAWKGIVEMLTAAFPNAVIYWFIPKTYQFNYNDAQYTRADGSKDWDAMLVSANQYGTYLFSNQTNMANYMDIPILDIRKEACINPGNISVFCNNNNVHPKNAGYNRWGEVLARMLE